MTKNPLDLFQSFQIAMRVSQIYQEIWVASSFSPDRNLQSIDYPRRGETQSEKNSEAPGRRPTIDQ